MKVTRLHKSAPSRSEGTLGNRSQHHQRGATHGIEKCDDTSLVIVSPNSDGWRWNSSSEIFRRPYQNTKCSTIFLPFFETFKIAYGDHVASDDSHINTEFMRGWRRSASRGPWILGGYRRLLFHYASKRALSVISLAASGSPWESNVLALSTCFAMIISISAGTQRGLIASRGSWRKGEYISLKIRFTLTSNERRIHW